MSKATHTPGPWRVRENAGHDQERCDLTICGDIFQLADINGPQYAHQIPNARLIAAAPDLLEALEYLVSLGGGDCLDPARAAIAKARGDDLEARIAAAQEFAARDSARRAAIAKARGE